MADSNWGLNNYDEKITVNFCTTKMERSGIMEERRKWRIVSRVCRRIHLFEFASLWEG